MYLRRIILFIILGILLYIFIQQEYHSGRENRAKESLYQKVEQILQEQQQGARRPQPGSAVNDERLRNKLLKAAEACDRHYIRCLERCE